jgi:ethanolamine ammonia-lyase large subunit
LLGLRHAPEFEAWLARVGIADAQGRLLATHGGQALLADLSNR